MLQNKTQMKPNCRGKTCRQHNYLLFLFLLLIASSKLPIVSILITHCLILITSLEEGGYVFGIIGLSVCLLAGNITQTVINGLKFYGEVWGGTKRN